MAPSVSTPLGRAPVIPLAILGAGIYLTWFGVHYWRSDVKWPTDPIKDILIGKGLPAADTPASYESQINTAASSGSSGSGTGAPSNLPPAGGDTSVHGGTASQNQATGKLVAAAYGWAPTQNNGEWLSLVKLWNQESGWNNQATNPGSGAYGIAQALGHGSAGTQGTVTNEYGGYGISDGMAQAANSGDAASQITWGLQYIKETYGDPNTAWAHEVSHGWY